MVSQQQPRAPWEGLSLLQAPQPHAQEGSVAAAAAAAAAAGGGSGGTRCAAEVDADSGPSASDDRKSSYRVRLGCYLKAGSVSATFLASPVQHGTIGRGCLHRQSCPSHNATIPVRHQNKLHVHHARSKEDKANSVKASQQS